MKRSLVSLAVMAVTGAASRQSVVCLHGSPSTELSIEGLRAWDYPEEQVQAALRRQIVEAAHKVAGDYRCGVDFGPGPDVTVVGAYQAGKTASLGLCGREDLGADLKLHAWQEDVVRRMREVPAWSMSWPAHYGRI